ncbi:hypothetical protein BGZ95_002859 [Linnemannia exigua]|uniref:Uncharacterized protein n=1 Tax=Linnemannia exigua TaxID=604196 RepID=A0AAD4D4Z7_9FUNG|nr:hypothetical protein BGZ95_002859 [Linnemannia exigua]
MAALPTFLSSCIAPDSDGQNAFLFGVPSPGTLEAHRINLSNPLTPTSTLVSSTTSSTGNGKWDASASLGCYAYLGDTPSAIPTSPPAANSTAPLASPPPFPPPITIIQFGNTIQTQFFPNGTWVNFESTTEATVDYLSPKLFSPVGSTNGWNWFLGRAAGQPKTWRSIRIASRTEAGSKDLTVAGSEPLLTVGAIAPDINNFGNGHLFFIDQSGSSGSIHRTTGNKRPIANLTATDTLVTLSKSSPLNMNSNTLTVDAVPVTSAFAAFILDKSDQGVVSVYSIDPRISTLTLTRTSVKGFSPLFQPTQSFTSLNSRIVVYGGAVPNAIHIFDVISGTWTGPALVDPAAAAASPNTNGLSMGIIGGIAAAAVVLLIVAGLVVWRIRRRRRTPKNTVNIPPSTNDDIKVPVNDNTIDLKMLENKSQSRFDDRKQDGSAPLTPTTALPSMPGTPVSQYKRHSSQQRRPGGVSRHASAYSIRSDGSTSRVYLAGPATVIPSTPSIPSAYSTVNLQQLQNAAAVYRSTSAPGTPNPRSADPPSRKGSAYKFSVPNDYDDRQPLHHHESSEEQQAYLQMSGKSSPSASPVSLNGSRLLEEASSMTLGNNHSHSHSLPSDQSRSDTSGNYPRPSFTSSHPASPKQPRPSTSTLDSEYHSQSSQQSQQQQVNPSSRSASRPRKKRADGAEPLVSPTSPTTPKESSSRYVDRRDSGSYKVEYRDTSSQQQQQQQRQYAHSNPTTPTSPYTPTTSSRLAPPHQATTSLSPSPTPSDTDTKFADSFPIPPKMIVPKKHKRAAPTPPSTGASGPNSPTTSVMPNQPTSSRTNRDQRQQQLQQQFQWLEEQYQQQQQQHQQQQMPSPSGRDGVESVAGSVGTMSPKTPKLVSLPRPIPRERERERERNRD